MGACCSKDDAQSTRNLSRWKADTEIPSSSPDSKFTAPSTVVHQSDVLLTNDLVLNTIAHNADFGIFDCITGWEDGTVKHLNWRTKAVVKTWQPHDRAVNHVVIGPRTNRLYSCSRDTTIAITPPTSSATADAVTVLRGHTLNVPTIAVNTSEETLCSGGRDTQTIFWDLRTGSLTSKTTTSQNVVTCSKWIPSTPLVLQGSEDLTVKVWDERVALRTPVETFRGYVYFPLSLDVANDGNYFVTSSKGFNGVGCEMRVWDRRLGKNVLECHGHQQDATACCFLPATAQSKSASLPTPVTASKDGTVKIWDITTGKVLCEAYEPSSNMFTSVCAVNSSTILASTFSGQIHAYAFDQQQQTLKLISS